MNSGKTLLNKSFSHIYVEKECYKYEETQKILNKFKDSTIIEIDSYKDIFCRKHQDFSMQKECTSLILSVKKGNLLYKGARFCDDFGNEYFTYTSCIMNCIYDCEYCYLRGMYPTSNIVIFVNIDDIFKELECVLSKHPVYLCVSYDTDLMAFENVTHYTRRWIEFSASHKNLKIEIRTKSANYNSIKDMKPLNNVIIAWTLSPELIISEIEHKTPPLKMRLANIKEALNDGWNVRICFDPMLHINNYQEIYGSLFDETFSMINGDNILDVSCGVFRVSSLYLKKMKNTAKNSKVLNYPYITSNNISTYDKDITKQMKEFAFHKLKEYISENKIYIRED